MYVFISIFITLMTAIIAFAFRFQSFDTFTLMKVPKRVYEIWKCGNKFERVYVEMEPIFFVIFYGNILNNKSLIIAITVKKKV